MNKQQGIKVVMDTSLEKKELLLPSQHLSINIYLQNHNSNHQIEPQEEKMNLLNFLSFIGLENYEVQSIIEFLQSDGITTIDELIRLDEEALENYGIPCDLIQEYEYFLNKDFQFYLDQLGITNKEQLEFLKFKQVKNPEYCNEQQYKFKQQLFKLTRKDFLQLNLDQRLYLEQKSNYLSKIKFDGLCPSPPTQNIQRHKSFLSTQTSKREYETPYQDIKSMNKVQKEQKAEFNSQKIKPQPYGRSSIQFTSSTTEQLTPQPQLNESQKVTDQVNDVMQQVLFIVYQENTPPQILKLQQEAKVLDDFLVSLLSQMLCELTQVQRELIILIQRLKMFIEQECLLIQSIYKLIELGITNLQHLKEIEDQDLEVCFLNKHLYNLIFFDEKLEQKLQELRQNKNVKSDLVILLSQKVTTLEAFYNDSFKPEMIKLPKQVYEQSRQSFLVQNYQNLPQQQKISDDLRDIIINFGESEDKIIQWQIKLVEMQILDTKQFFQLNGDQIQSLKLPKYKFKFAEKEYQQQSKKSGIILRQIPLCQLNQQEIQLENIKKQCKKSYQRSNLTVFNYPKLRYSQISIQQGLKTIVFIGQTGSGKSTLIDFWLNYHFGVKYQDNYRFSVHPQQQTQTQDITIYYVQDSNGNPALRIIDTPGFSSNDSQIAEKIKEYFRIEIDTLTTICFVMQAQLERLTKTQNQLINLILQMYGADVINNFFFMFTFSDSNPPLAKDALLFQGNKNHEASPLASYVNQLQEPWYLTINSQGYLNAQQDQINTQHQWEHAIKSFHTFVEQKVKKIVDIKLSVAQDIEELKNYILKLRMEILQLLSTLQSYYTRYNEIQKLTEEQIKSKQKFVETRLKITQEDVPSGQYATICVVCNHTCHYPCGVNDDNKSSCDAMRGDHCTACDKQCHYTQHRNATYILKHENYQEELEVEALKEQYEMDNSEQSAKEQIKIGVKQECLDLEIKCMENQVLLWKNVNQLNKNVSSVKTMSEYVDIMIKEEEKEQRSGYLDRIAILKNMKQIWNQIEQKQQDSDQIQYKKEEIKKALEEKHEIFINENI